MRVVIAIIALILFVLLARFVYLKVRESQNPIVTTNTILPIPSPSYFPAFSPSPSPTATSGGALGGLLKATPKATPKVSPKPEATVSGSVGKLPTTGSNDAAYILGAAVVAVLGFKLRQACA